VKLIGDALSLRFASSFGGVRCTKKIDDARNWCVPFGVAPKVGENIDAFVIALARTLWSSLHNETAANYSLRYRYGACKATRFAVMGVSSSYRA
jgi:hypothetical protein